MKIKGAFCKKVVAPKTAFDKRSFRWKKSGRGFVLVGCPKGKWSPKSATCKGPTRAHEVLVRANGSCSVGKRVKK